MLFVLLILQHRQQWFTYSYCHNNQVRQFREAIHPHPHPPGELFSDDVIIVHLN